jgi:hypothetical protein
MELSTQATIGLMLVDAHACPRIRETTARSVLPRIPCPVCTWINATCSRTPRALTSCAFLPFAVVVRFDPHAAASFQVLPHEVAGPGRVRLADGVEDGAVLPAFERG